MSEKVRLRIKYWTIFFNPVVLFVYAIGCSKLYLLCQFGGVRRRLPWIAICGVVGVIWIIVWTALYFNKKRAGIEGIPVRYQRWLLFLSLEIWILILITGFYGTKIVHSAKAYNGKLSWKMDEIKSSRKIRLKHNNIYQNGIEGIFEDLKKELKLPDELYIADEFSLKFTKDGTITEIDSFFYGRNSKGVEHSFQIDYDRHKSDKITVWLNGYVDSDYADEMKMNPFMELLDMVDIQQELQTWDARDKAEQFGILYKGYRSFPGTQGIVAIDEDGSARALGDEDAAGEDAGYTVSLYVPGDERIIPKRYMNMWDKVHIEENPIDGGKEQFYEIGACTIDPSEGTLYFFVDQDTGWRLMVTGAALGSRSYGMDATDDGGSTWNKINADPFSGKLGVAEGIVFFDQALGFIGIGGASGQHCEIYVTTDGGQSFAEVLLPIKEITDDVTNIQEHNYMNMPERVGSLVQIVLGKEKYSEGKGLLFQSEDSGAHWQYVGLIDSVVE